MKEIIYIFGASGSGTSTLGKYISEQLGYEFMDSDDYFWLPTTPPFTQKRDQTERIRLMKMDIDRADNMVISGSITNWGDELIPMFTLAVRLITDTEVRIDRIRKREYDRFGNRILSGGEMFDQHQAFIKWAADYDSGDITMRSKLSHDEWQKKLNCRMMILSGSDSLEYNLKLIRQELV